MTKARCKCGKSMPKRYACCSTCFKNRLPKPLVSALQAAEYAHDTKEWAALKREVNQALGGKHATDASS
jgi:hypothetical protein